ncbi:sigma-70 family RNA polymerase sigma factor [Planctellipticum variicoloris]|uniref:sigma-70 family RNA polymerase sigma factor n=1 Tax=Planctellipticum variicoloris TaxID=3064265 RepID=UPI003013FBC2|nr:sigma-70 family RNA polymerase sigma factor [Planctomycetaceae bacterium SH412]
MSDPVSAPPRPDFARLLVQHDRAVLRYIMTFIPRRDDAEEVLQRTATVLWEKFEEYDAAREFLPWALRVAYFEVLTFRKEAARSRLVFCEDVIEKLAETRQGECPILEAQQSALQECLAKLTGDSAALLRRRYCDSQTVPELAAESGKTAKSLYRRLDRLRELIAACVERRLASDGILKTAD